MNINKLSIITLTYKNWRLLDKAITSVTSQVIDEKYLVEYLVVDDGTEDFDIDWVRSLLDNTGINYKIVINERNLGTVQSFNKAIQSAVGDLIIPLSADDEFYDEFVVNDIVDTFIKTNAYIITGLRVPILNSKMLPSLPEANKYSLFCHPKKLLKHLLVQGNIISGASTYYRREIFNIIGPFDESYRLLEDYPFYIKALTLDINVTIYQRKVVKYGTSGISAKGRLNPILQQDFYKLHEEFLTRQDLTLFEKRKIVFFKLMSKREKIINSWRYPEQLINFLYVYIRTYKRNLFI